ncbi:hypothetical protein [Streptomyces sp. NPDC058653]|uniref:hypothetical protein n=1 Tax=Streptomyces sp. NPDC058653 TaxID=3346576 RepID=UPI0036575CBD
MSEHEVSEHERRSLYGGGPEEGGGPGPAGDPGEDASPPAEERELRILLERVVPRLHAPEERLRRVRERAARSRRRRRAAGTSAAVTGLVVAGTLLPGFLRGPDEGAPPASPAPTVATTDSAGGHAVRFPDLGDLTLRLPPGWQALAVPSEPEFKSAPRGFVASQPVPTVTPVCPTEPETFCDPVRTLRPGGVLVSLDPKNYSGFDTGPKDPSVLRALAEPQVLCRKLGGTEEYSALLPGPDPEGGEGIQVSVCTAGAGASSPIVGTVRAMIADVDYPAPGAHGPEPSRAPTPHAENDRAE